MADPQDQDWKPGDPPPWLATPDPASDPSQTQFSPDGTTAPPAAAADAPPGLTPSTDSPPAAAAPALTPPPIDDSLPGAPNQTGTFAPPDHWFAPSSGSPEDPYASPPLNDSATDVDAISGGATRARQYDQDLARGGANGIPVEPMQTENEHAAAVASNASLPLEQREKALNDSSLTPQQKAEVIAKMKPEDVATLQIKDEQAKVHWQAQQQLEASKRAAEDSAAHLQMYQAAQTKAAADTQQWEVDAKALANTKVDTGFHGSVGEAIARVLLSAIGGGMSQFTGGHNLALEQFQKNNENDIQAQKDNIANRWRGLDARKGAIATELERHGDLFRAQETYRLASYDRAISDIATKAQDFDPDGTTAIRLAQTSQQFQTARAQQAQALFDHNVKQNIEIGKAHLDTQKELRETAAQEEAARHNRAGEGIDWAKVAIERTKAAKEDKADKERSIKLGERVIDGMPLGVDPKTGAVQRGPITQADGTAFVPRTEKQAEDLQKTKPYVNRVNQLANQMARDIADLGTLDKSSHLATAKHQRLMSDREALIFALHGSEGIEGFRPGTADMLTELLGGVDPDKWGRDATAGILRAKDNINADFTEKLHGAGWDGNTYSPPDTSKLQEPTATKDEQQIESLMKIGHGEVNEGEIVATPQRMAEIQLLQARAAAGDTGAGEMLLRVATDAPNSKLRAYAQQVLQTNAMPDIPASEAPGEPGQSAPSTNVVREIAPPAPPPPPEKKKKAHR